MTHNTTYSDETRECTRMQRNHPQILHKHAPRARDISSIAFSNAGARFAASAAQPGIWRCATKLHRNAKPCICITRGALRANILGISVADSTLEGAASKAHLSPMHGTRAARELHPESRMADTDNSSENSQCVSRVDVLASADRTAPSRYARTVGYGAPPYRVLYSCMVTPPLSCL